MSPEQPGAEPERPRPRLRALTIHELRGLVKAPHKFAAAGKPEAEAVKLLQDEYKVDATSALAFVNWLKGVSSPSPPSLPAGSVLESWHRQGNLEKGTEDLLSDKASDEVRKSAQKAAPKGKKKPS